MRGIILFASALDELSGYSVPVTDQDLESYFPIKAGKKGEWRQRTIKDQVKTYGLFCVSLGLVLVFKRHGYKEHFLTERGRKFVKVSVLNRIQEDLLRDALLTE